jgi:hypothetical protein
MRDMRSQAGRSLQVFLLLAFAGIAASPTRAGETLVFSPAAAHFGNVGIGSSKTIQVTIKNIGPRATVLTRENLSGDMYTLIGSTPPVSIEPGRHVMISIKFEPTKEGSLPGSVIIGSGIHAFGKVYNTGLVSYSLTGTGVAPVPLEATPSSVHFGSVPVGTSVFQSVELKNSGTHSATISSASVLGAGFTIIGLTTPMTLAAGTRKSFTLKFEPTGVGTDSGLITLKSSSAKELTLSMTGTGTKDTGAISASPASLSFGSGAVGSKHKQAVTLKNTGNSQVTISGVSLTGIDASLGSDLNGATIAPGQTATFLVTFSPKNAKRMSGSVKISSNAANSPTVVTLSGTGVSVSPASGGSSSSASSGKVHSVALRWDASTSPSVVGYNVYRAISPSTTYAILSSSPIGGLNYTDGTVEAGQTYTYVVTAVNPGGEESPHSQSVSAVIP